MKTLEFNQKDIEEIRSKSKRNGLYYANCNIRVFFVGLYEVNLLNDINPYFIKEYNINMCDMFLDYLSDTTNYRNHNIAKILNKAVNGSSYEQSKIKEIILNPKLNIGHESLANKLIHLNTLKKMNNFTQNEFDNIIIFLEQWSSWHPFDNLVQSNLLKFLDKIPNELKVNHKEFISTISPKDNNVDNIMMTNDSFAYTFSIDVNIIANLKENKNIKKTDSFILIAMQGKIKSILKIISEEEVLRVNDNSFLIKSFNIINGKDNIEGSVFFESENQREHFKKIFSIIIKEMSTTFLDENKTPEMYVKKILEYQIKNSVDYSNLKDNKKNKI